MKKKNTKNLLKIYFASFILTLTFASCDKVQESSEYTHLVNPHIGSGGHGHVFVGASVPFGAVQLGPNNIYKGWDWCSGYHYSDSIVIGFSHTHLSGTGCSDLGDILMMPATGEINLNRGEQNDISNSYASFYTHENEKVKPGYYSLLLDKNQVNVELTATERVGIHKYTFPDKDENHVIIDLKEGNGDEAYETYLKQVNDNTIEGYRFSKGWAKDQQIWFTLECNQKIEKLDLYDNTTLVEGSELKGTSVKGVISFSNAPEEVIIKVGISPISSANALANIKAEAPDWDFDKIANLAQAKWEEALSKIKVETTTTELKETFYTALFHTYIAPALFNDADGSYRGTDKKIYTSPGFNNYSVFSLWDTYRTANQLLTITQPERVNDMINSMLNIYLQQEKLPVWHLLGNETNTMPGYSAVPIVVDAWAKGFRGFDENLAFEAIKNSATYPKQKGVSLLMDKGYIPCDKVKEATSIALEYAVDDWSIAQMAKQMGKQEDFEYFSKRADYYKEYFDKDINFIRPKMDDGTWRTPYDPFSSVHMIGDFTEGNGWQYTFFAPQCPEGLIGLFNGDENFTTKLDSFFVAEGDMGEEASSDITGLIGMYAHGNEPSHHIAYLYAFAGQQWKTAEKVRFILDKFYTNQIDGLIGNEDCGQMSAWYIMSSLGFYPVNPSNGIYVFGSPLFDKTTIRLPEGKAFTIESVNNNKENIYIQSVELNGKEYTKSYITYKDIVSGGSLKFIMGSEPNYNFGSASDDRPKSLM